MKISLHPEMRVRDIQQTFRASFPYLKIEFLKRKHAPGIGSPAPDIVSPQAMLIDATGAMKEGEIEIVSWQSVADVEQLFQKRFNLPVQIFRKTKFAWIETTTTDHLSLAKQNRMGRESCNAIYDSNLLL